MQNEMFEKFNAMFDLEGLKSDIDDAASKNTEFVEIPHGDYEVKVVKLELGETSAKSKSPGMPMGKIWYTILAGDYKNQMIFQNQMLTSGFGIHFMNELLTSFQSDFDVEFENFEQYGQLLEDIAENIKDAEYQLSYSENNKGYDTYEIVQRFK